MLLSVQDLQQKYRKPPFHFRPQKIKKMKKINNTQTYMHQKEEEIITLLIYTQMYNQKLVKLKKNSHLTISKQIIKFQN